MNTKKQACFLRVLIAAVLLASAAAVSQDGEGGYDAPYFQADFTQDLNDWTSALVNPALTYRVNQMHASMAFYRWGLDRGNMGYQDFTLLYPIRLSHTAGLTVLHARNTMERVKRDDSGGENDSKGGVMTSYQDLWMIGNYGVRVMPWLMLGGNLKFRTQAQFGQNAFSKIPGLDVGVYINPFDHYHWGDIGLSLTAQDILPTQTPWEFISEFGGTNANDLVTVSRGRIGLRYSGLNDNLVANFEFLIDNAFRDIFAAMNWEAFYNMATNVADGQLPSSKDFADMFPIALRWGFHVKYMFIPQIWLKGGWTNNNIPYLGFSYNFLYPLPEMINYMTLDYNFGYSFMENFGNASSLNDERGLVMMLKLSSDFGRTREQKESRRMYNKLVVEPMDIYQQAMRLYVAGKYWEASFAYGRLLATYPNFHLNDKAVYYMGDCYKHLYMNNTAREVFREALDEYTTSDMRAYYLYGIMSLDYREENYDEAMRNHSFIINLYAESEIVGEAEYLAGEINFHKGQYSEAMKHFQLVKRTDPSYLYAQYTMGVINYLSDNNQAAIQNLRTIIDDTTSRAADVKLQHAAAVKLGHVYFEMGNKFREAVESYALVPKNASPSGDEALLGTAWAWIRANQPQLALQEVDRIISMHPQSPFVPEAHLLRGYTMMLQKDYVKAIPAFERCLTAVEGEYLTDEHVSRRRVQYDREFNEFAPVADKIKKNAMRKPLPRTLEERPGLQKGYEKFAKENKEFFEYRVLAKSHKHFFMQKEQIINDATYALAKATNLVRSRGLTDALEKERREMEKIRQALEENEAAE